jgi:HK97 family phage major capsid protein
MASAYLRSKVDERAALTDVVDGILKKCSDESREPSPEERSRLDEYGTRIKALDGTIVELRTQEEANARFLGVAQGIEAAEEDSERRGAARKTQTEPEIRSAGEAFIQSEQFKRYRGYGTMEPVEFEDFLGMETRMAVLTGPITEALLKLPPERWDGPAGPTVRAPFLSLIGREVVSTNAVSYITWGDYATGAAEVAETDTKPEATLTPTEHPVTLKTYAFWKAITRQALEDYPRIRSIVESKLRIGLAQELETVATGVLSGVAAPGTATNLEGIRSAIATLQENGYTPTAIAMNPQDAALLDLEVMGSTLLGPNSPGNYWGVRVVPVGSIPAGTAYVADWTQAVTWFDRSSASVYMSDSHADYFIRNLFVILAEQRSTFALTEPNAVVAVTVAAATPPALTASASK